MQQGMIVAPQPEAVEVGALVLRSGGNAVDAAIACALVQSVVDPQQCGIAGFGSMQIYMPAKDVHTFIDFHATAPAATTPDMWEHLLAAETPDGFGFVLEGNVNDVGYQSIAVPGSLKAYHEAQTSYGTIDWADIVAPAIKRAREGFLVRPQMHQWWNLDDGSGRVSNVTRMGFTEPSRRLYFDPSTNQPLGIGKRVVNEDMARTLEIISREGADVFYEGELAERMARDMADNGGLITLDDLKSYHTVRRDPLRCSYRGLDIATNRPPGGGIMLVEMLNILENFDLAEIGHNSTEYVRVLAEAMKQATADKDAFVGDPNFIDVPYDRLTDRAYAQLIAAKIRAGKIAHVDRFNAPPEAGHTTHISVLDHFGNAVSMTHSLGTPSGVITEGLGFMYNGCMSVFDPRPGKVASLAPGKSRFSSIAPTMLFKNGDPTIIVGAPGGTQIAMGVLQVILNLVDHGMSPTEAVAAPRFSGTHNSIDICNRIPDYLVAPLRDKGYTFTRSPFSYAFAGVHAILKDDNGLSGGADPAYDGMALLV